MDNKDYEIKYAWNWFQYHAQQRYQAFNIFLLVMGALAYGYSLANNNSHVKFGVGVLGFIISFSFLFIEKRSNTLVNDGREALKGYDKRSVLREILEKDTKRKSANRFFGFISSHKFWFRIVIITSLVTSYLAILDSLNYLAGIKKNIPACLFNCSLIGIPVLFIIVAFVFGFIDCQEGEGNKQLQ